MATLCLEPGAHQPVAPVDDSPDELPILLLGLEVAAASEYQTLMAEGPAGSNQRSPD